MHMIFNTFLKPGTDLMKLAAGIAIMLFFVATTAAVMGWISASVGSDGRTQSNQLAGSTAQGT